MANTWKPGEEGINPSYTDRLAEFDPAARAANADNSKSKDLLRQSENNALASNEPTYNRSDSSWRNNVSGRKAPDNKKSQGKAKFTKQRKGILALVLAISLTAAGGAFIGGSHSLLGPAMSSILTTQSDYRYTSTYSQWINNKFMKSIMNKSQGVNGKPTNLSDEFIENLKTFDIDVNDNGSSYTFTYKGKTITGDNFTDTFKNDVEFRTAFTNAKQGRAANFFDTKATTTYTHYGITRNELKNYRDTGDIDVDTENYNSTLSKKFDNHTAEITTTRAEEKEEEVKDANGDPVLDKDGKPQTTTTVENERNETALSDTTSNTDFEVAKTKASDFINKIGKVTNVLNWSCTVMRTGNMVIKTASAMERISSILYFMGIMEGISKMMAGEGSSSGYNVLMNFLVRPVTTAITDYNNASASASYDNSNKNAEGTLSVNIGETTVSGAPVQSNLTNILADRPIDKNLAHNFSFDSMAMLFTGAFGFTTMKAAGCAVSNIGESVASLAVNLLPGGQGVKIVGGMILKNIFIGITSFSVGSILGFLIPKIAKTLFMNTFLDAKGIEGGEYIARSAFLANGELAQSAGNGYGTNEDAIEFGQVTDTVLAMEAESDRINRSPFDINSKNTFLGNIAYNLLATTISNSTYSALNSLAGATSKSLASLATSTRASTGTGTSGNSKTQVLNTDNNCTFSSMDIAGTAWCTTLPVTNKHTLEISPTDQDYIDVINKELDCSSGECEIDKNSDLAKTASYCFYRDTPPDETPDARILSELHSTPSLLSAVGTIFPQVNDVINIIEGFQDLTNIGWATGDTCTNHPNMDYYKAYFIHEGLFEQTMANKDGTLAYVSPVTRYIEQYNAEHPINNMTDLIAHHAGLTTDDADLMLALVEYYNFIEEYQPDTRIALEKNTPEQLDGEIIVASLSNNNYFKINSKNDYYATIAIINQPIIYTDIRNRSYAV